MDEILQPGRNCWRRVPAERVAFLIDAASYFDALAEALERARRSILIVGWDVHSRARLRPQQREDPCELGPLLDRLVARTPALSVHILLWDYAPIYLLERELLPMWQLGWRRHPRVHVDLAADHPVGASHHQKLVVIDDRMAFLGGVDLTIARWDESAHRPEDERRRLPDGSPYGPFHDVQLAVDGEAAGAVAELARARWASAGAEVPGARDEGDPEHDPWPPSLAPDLERTQVALARTRAAWKREPEQREVEALYLDAIAAAEGSIYIENQYLTSTAVCEALAARLAGADGPEILIVTPYEQMGRLEQASMGALRAQRVASLRAADRHGRLRILAPVVGDAHVNVHAKVMVVDDRLARVGSANLSNRSMGLDSECDACVEARDPSTVAVIRRFRDRLLGEHLGCSAEHVAEACDRTGSLLAAVDALVGGSRTLVALEADPGEGSPALELADPDEPLDAALLRQSLPADAREQGARRLPYVFAGIVLALGLAAVWAWTPLGTWIEPARMAELAAPLRARVWGPAVAVLGFVAASLAMVPVAVLIVAVILLFGPWLGAACALAGSLGSASAAYGIGSRWWRDGIRRLAGRRLNRLSRALARRGLLSIVVVRVVPVAPFTVLNLVAGSSHIRFRDYLLGTLLGMAPGIVGMAFATDRIVAAVRDPSPLTLAAAAAVMVALGLGFRLLRGWLQRRG
ncbi:VTT domain-containing protein [Haliangium sp.]|uniref:VTT domain-containing protein n=1 Tax=Haliangium sp. TaxID=2663208 RepID=UPI003D0D11CD